MKRVYRAGRPPVEFTTELFFLTTLDEEMAPWRCPPPVAPISYMPGTYRVSDGLIVGPLWEGTR